MNKSIMDLEDYDDIEQQCREFAVIYPLPNVLRGIDYAKAGAISWQDLYDLFKKALTKVAIEEMQ